MSTVTITEPTTSTNVLPQKTSSTSARTKLPKLPPSPNNSNKKAAAVSPTNEEQQQQETSPQQENNNNNPPSTARSNNKTENNQSPTPRYYNATTASTSARSSPSMNFNNNNNIGTTPALAQKEYISELRVRQNSQLASVASYLETHAREPFGALCGKNLGGWTYGPSYSRTVESLDPEAESYPPTKSARRTVILSSARSLPFNVEQELRRRSPSPSSPQQHSPSTTRGRTTATNTSSSSRPNTARSTATSTLLSNNNTIENGGNAPLIKTSFYNVILEAPFNVRPSSARFSSSSNGMLNISSGGGSNNNSRSYNLQQNQMKSARPLSSEYYYPTRQRALTNDELVSKSDRAVQKHRDKQRRLEIQKERLKNAAPMEFRWQM